MQQSPVSDVSRNNDRVDEKRCLDDALVSRRKAFVFPAAAIMMGGFLSSCLDGGMMLVRPAMAYTPDPDPLKESLYLMSRVQEATVQQERFVSTAIASLSSQEALKQKMKLTLRLVEKNYRLVDQINYASQFVLPAEEIVTATNAGLEAADSLQNAIDYVNLQLRTGPLRAEQAEYLRTNLSSCRNELFTFLQYMPQDKLEQARKRVEEENVLNRDEFDGPDDAGVYNPVVLPWKQQQQQQ